VMLAARVVEGMGDSAAVACHPPGRPHDAVRCGGEEIEVLLPRLPQRKIVFSWTARRNGAG